VNILLQARKILLFLLITTAFPLLYGQDIHFSQFLNSPLTLNPAMTGNFEGDWRIVGNYRDQWRALEYPFKTLSASYDRQVYIKKHRLSAGLYVVNDVSGEFAIKTNKVYASGAYYRTFNKHQVSLGFQVGYVLNRVDYNGLDFPGDYNNVTGTYDQNNHPLNNSGYLDVNIGFTWSRKIRIFEPQVGIALYHINNPTMSYIERNANIPMRGTFHASLRSNLSPVLFVKPSVLFNNIRGSKDFMFGSEAGFVLQGNRYNIREITAGIYARNLVVENVDAMIIMIGAQYSNLAFQLSYDINVSSLNQYTNNRGAFELSIIFKSISTIIKTFTIPCERI